MKTAEIILQLINITKSTPASLYQIPWHDLKVCFITELDYRTELYPMAQFQTIKQLVQDCFDAIDHFLAIPDTSAIIALLNRLAFALQFLPDAEHVNLVTRKVHFNEVCLNHYINDTTIVLGDSHVNFFSGNELLTFSPIGNNINVCPTITDKPITALHLGPCLAYNSNKTVSSTRFHEKVNYLCNHFIKPNAKIICSLGEIDLRVHVFRQTLMQNRPYQQIVDDIISEYISFLISLKEKEYQVFCWGPSLPKKKLVL